MDMTPPVAEAIRIVTLDVKAPLQIVLKNRNRIVASLEQQVDGFRPKQCRVETIKKNRSAAALRVSDFAGEDRFARRVASTIALKVAVPDHLDQLRPQGFRCAAQHEVAAGIRGSRFCTELIAVLVDNPFATNDDDILLKVVQILDPLDEQFDIERMFRDQDNVRLPVCCTQSNVAGPPAHDLYNSDTPMAFRCRANALDALGRNKYRCGVPRRGVIDDLVQAE